jgi:hypothetical protein
MQASSVVCHHGWGALVTGPRMGTCVCVGAAAAALLQPQQLDSVWFGGGFATREQRDVCILVLGCA